MAPFRQFDHEADMGLEIEAASFEALFTEAVRGMTACLTDLSSVRAKEMRRVEASGQERTELLVHWLREWLYLYATLGFLPASVRMLELSGTRAVGEARGEIRDPGRHPVAREIKAVTHHQAKIERVGERWRVRVIFDV